MSNPETTRKCYICDGTMSTVREKAEIKIGQRSAVVNVTRARCDDCGEIFYTPAQMQAAQTAAASELRRQDGLLDPASILRIREKYGLSQAQFEQLLGIGPKTVVRWERGTVFQSRTADELMRMVDAIPGAFAYLAEKNKVECRTLSIGADSSQMSTFKAAGGRASASSSSPGAKVVPFRPAQMRSVSMDDVSADTPLPKISREELG